MACNRDNIQCLERVEVCSKQHLVSSEQNLMFPYLFDESTMHVDDEAKQDEDPLLHSSSTSSLVPIPRRYKYHGWSSFVLFMGVMLVGGVFGFILGFSVSTHKKPFPFDYVDADKFCIRHVNHYCTSLFIETDAG
jgi:acyl dehydratase